MSEENTSAPIGRPDNVSEFKPRAGANPESVKIVPAGVQVLEKLLHDHAKLEEYVMNLAATVIAIVETLQEKGVVDVIDADTGEPDPGNLDEMQAQAEAMVDRVAEVE